MNDPDETTGEPAAHATDVTPGDVARRRGFHGDAIAPAGNPETDPIAREGEPAQQTDQLPGSEERPTGGGVPR